MKVRKGAILGSFILAAIGIAAAVGFRFSAERQFSARLHQACLADSPTVVLADIVPFSWDEVAILGPYASQEGADRALGFPWRDYGSHQDALESEGKDVLIFLNRGQIVGVFEHARIAGDFTNAVDKRLPRPKAVFAFHRSGNTCDFVELTLSEA